jgi:ABC-2 type transport system permease protein
MTRATVSPATAVLLNEWRLATRGLADMIGRGGERPGLRLAGLLSVMLLVVFGIASAILSQVGVLDAGNAKTLVTVSVNLSFIFILMISAALDSATFTLYSRGDYDLLFSAPVSPRVILLVRAANVFCFTIAKVTLYGAPFLMLLALERGPQWLLGFPLFMALALAASALAIGLAMALVRLIGIKRTRVVSQVIAALAGLLVFVMMQWDVVIAPAVKDSIATPAGNLPDGLFWQLAFAPARALLGDGSAAFLVIALAGLFCAGLLMVLARPFADNAVLAAGTEAAPASSPRKQDKASFGRSPFAALALKERRLILRDPWILSQILMQCLFLLPISIFAVHQFLIGKQDASSLAPLLVVLSGQIAGGLAWIALAADDAPDLVATAPLDGATMRRAKLFAVAWLTWVLVATPLILLLWAVPATGLMSFCGVAASVVCAILINLWHQPRNTRVGMIRRRAKGSTIVNLMEIGCLMLIGTTVWLMLQGLPSMALAAMGLAAVVMAMLYVARRPTLPGVEPAQG